MKEVVLTTHVEHLGHEGDVVKVADGYARNYLLPKQLAMLMTPATKHQIARLQERREAERKRQLEEAQQLAARLESTSVTIAVKTGEQGKLFGSVGTSDIAGELEKQGITLDRHSIVLDQPLRELGVFSTTVKLHPEVQASLKIWVVEE